MTGQVDGKVALVTGGASGIGAACAARLAREGARVAITDLDEASGAALAERIAGQGGTALFLRQDVTDEKRWPEVIGAVEERYGRLDILVANAGIGIYVPTLAEMTLADWRRQTAVNLDGVFLSIKHGVPALRRAGGGSIVVMSSVAGLRGSPGLAGYCATKGAVRLLAKAAALEFAADRIRVNSVHPGIIVTPIWEKIPSAVAGSNNPAIDPRAVASAVVPLATAGEAEDIANGVLYLCADGSRHVTGSELVIDGGLTAGSKASNITPR